MAFGLYDIHSSAARLMIKGTDLSTHTYASEEGRENNRFLANSRGDELGPLQLFVEFWNVLSLLNSTAQVKKKDNFASKFKLNKYQ